VREPQDVARSAPARVFLLLVALLVVVPVAVSARRAALAAAFLVEFLSDGRVRALSGDGPPPVVRAAAPDIDLYVASRSGRGVPLVLVHGYAPEGKDEPRLQRAAALFARAGFDVAVPTIPGLTRGRLRAPDVAPVLAALELRRDRTAMVSVSVGAGPALLAAADPRVRDRIAVVLSVGGYASARELLRFYLVGEYAWDGVHGRAHHDSALVRAFLGANADLVAAVGGVDAGDPARAAALLDAPPPPLAALLDALSPERVARDIRARLLLVHGRDDIAVPYTESLRLAAARPARTRVILVGVLEHVDPAQRLYTHVRDLLALWVVVYAMFASV
jgi:pimeloyl-ACP methyl ester carboxylesterase